MRAIRAAIAAGVEVQRFEIDKDGKIIVITDNAQEPVGAGSQSDLDQELEEWETRHGQG
jgi:hypothetical protein